MESNISLENGFLAPKKPGHTKLKKVEIDFEQICCHSHVLHFETASSEIEKKNRMMRPKSREPIFAALAATNLFAYNSVFIRCFGGIPNSFLNIN